MLHSSTSELLKRTKLRRRDKNVNLDESQNESYADEDKSQVTDQTKLSGMSQRKIGETSLDGPKRSELIKRKI